MVLYVYAVKDRSYCFLLSIMLCFYAFIERSPNVIILKIVNFVSVVGGWLCCTCNMLCLGKA